MDRYIDLVVKTAVTTYSTLWVFEAMATITFILRILSRSFLTRDIGWEDAIMALGWAVSLTGSVLLTWSVHAMTLAANSVGSVMGANIVLALKLAVISSALVSTALWLPKISVALVLVHLLQPSRWIKIVLVSGSVLSLLLLCLPSVVITFVQCNPIPGQWDRERYQPTCWSPDITVKIFIVTTGFSVFWDFVYAVYPATVLWKMRFLPTSRKVEISILMGLGLISGAVGIYKTSLLPLLDGAANSEDEAASASHTIAMWTNIEADFIITAGCVPLTTPVYRLVKKHVVAVLRVIGNRIRVRSNGADRGNTQDIEGGGYNELAARRTTNKPLPPLPSPRSQDARSQMYIGDDFEIQIYPDDTITLSQIPKRSWLELECD